VGLHLVNGFLGVIVLGLVVGLIGQ
ncbi:DUF1761 domain-containing protein, partial [Listeria monocytogenes]|nr:DUF1761 domain-containing protein [Listeria monocytogenes]